LIICDDSMDFVRTQAIFFFCVPSADSDEDDPDPVLYVLGVVRKGAASVPVSVFGIDGVLTHKPSVVSLRVTDYCPFCNNCFVDVLRIQQSTVYRRGVPCIRCYHAQLVLSI